MPPRVGHRVHAGITDERTFLRKIGGGYIFIHRLLQDYFRRRMRASETHCLIYLEGQFLVSTGPSCCCSASPLAPGWLWEYNTSGQDKWLLWNAAIPAL